MVTKTMKGIQEETWAEFKSLAAKNNMKTGQFFERLVHSYKDNSERFWDDILCHKKIISDKEAREMHKVVKEIRSEWGFRK